MVQRVLVPEYHDHETINRTATIIRLHAEFIRVAFFSSCLRANEAKKWRGKEEIERRNGFDSFSRSITRCVRTVYLCGSFPRPFHPFDSLLRVRTVLWAVYDARGRSLAHISVS